MWFVHPSRLTARPQGSWSCSPPLRTRRTGNGDDAMLAILSSILFDLLGDAAKDLLMKRLRKRFKNVMGEDEPMAALASDDRHLLRALLRQSVATARDQRELMALLKRLTWKATSTSRKSGRVRKAKSSLKGAQQQIDLVSQIVRRQRARGIEERRNN